jgi:hypothetical protein
MFGVVAVHVAVSLVWSLGVRKAGIGAVTWGVSLQLAFLFPRYVHRGLIRDCLVRA